MLYSDYFEQQSHRLLTFFFPLLFLFIDALEISDSIVKMFYISELFYILFRVLCKKVLLLAEHQHIY